MRVIVSVENDEEPDWAGELNARRIPEARNSSSFSDYRNMWTFRWDGEVVVHPLNDSGVTVSLYPVVWRYRSSSGSESPDMSFDALMAWVRDR